MNACPRGRHIFPLDPLASALVDEVEPDFLAKPASFSGISPPGKAKANRACPVTSGYVLEEVEIGA